MPRESPPADRRHASPAVPDSVDEILAEWAAERPDLPVTPIAVVTRLNRLRTRFDEELATVFARFDLSSADFTVIAALRRAGVPYTLPQSVLMNRLGLTSGTVSVRLTRLVKKGIVDRRPSPEDARGIVVTLTERGTALFDEIAPIHLANEELLLSALTTTEQQHLAALLHKLLVGFEHQRSTSPLGMTLAPAHLARRMRSAVGLPDTPGLLITDVAPHSRADAAGLRPGDLLTSVGDTELRSCVTLAEALAGASDVTISYLRGTHEHRTRLTPG
ncbi:MarR family transcriptional regulator [Micromonospora sp. NPDC050980]|uniref:MarR family transcriptional regulator n=1 Tax=Micromonospora sp. NPDC050980 TaxID=3155161 RepID=UPI0033E2751C